MAMLSASELGVEIDYGVSNPLRTLQRLENGDWQDYRLGSTALIPTRPEVRSKGDQSNQNLDCHVSPLGIPVGNAGN